MDIREFYRSTQEKQNQNTSNNSNNSSTHSKQDFSEYKETINKYKDLSQSELYSELLSQASDLKAQGKLDNNMLDKISTTLLPMLNEEQQKVLNNIIERIK